MENKLIKRCRWARSPEYVDHHDNFWGKGPKEENILFEYLCLEGQAVGLSFDLILKKHHAYRLAFYNFEPKLISTMTQEDVNKLVENKNIVRHKQKIQAIVSNAKAYLEMTNNNLTLSELIYGKKKDKIQLHHEDQQQTLTLTKTLKQFGFSFIGPTTVYAYLQAVGLYDHHEFDCDWNYQKKKFDTNK